MKAACCVSGGTTAHCLGPCSSSYTANRDSPPLIIGIVGMTNKMYDEPSNILWWLPVLVALFFPCTAWFWQGQKLGHEQMVQLHRFLKITWACAVHDRGDALPSCSICRIDEVS